MKICKGYREYDKKGNWTGRWLCINCWQKFDPNSPNNIRKSLAGRRTGNIDPNSSSGKGDIFEQIVCKARGVKNLNYENDNFNEPLDHSRDPELGIIQTKGAIYNSINGVWKNNGFGIEHKKEFDYIIFLCMDAYMKNIERAYHFPKKEVKKRTGITITKNPSRGGQWYEKYRVDEKPYNDAYHILRN